MNKILKISFIFIILILIPLFWYLLSPLFIDNVVSEDLPINIVSNEEENLEPIMMSTFSGADSFHKVTGKAVILKSDNQKFLRLENFESTNGPDLYVYLSKDLDASDFVNLGKLKGNKGNQNYEIDNSINLEEYPYVLIYCKNFRVLFGSSKLF
ncbi:MAG: DM13 domain-containing protein [Nanoarchaeota archaeon]|nr:DM13 domain-containing protein [Nanoarchaeota archaeon]